MEVDKCLELPYHRKSGPCWTRPLYRDGRKKTAVKVYTVTDESCFLLFFGVPSINLLQVLKTKCKQFGQIDDFRKLCDYPNVEKFTDVFLVKCRRLDDARSDGILFIGRLLFAWL